MKHMCEKCGQKYAIPDAKVAGKLLRVRCTRCQGVMAVDGSHVLPGRVTAPITVIPTVVAQEGMREWYVGIAGKPQGPFNRAEVLSRVAEGEVRLRTFMWRQPMTAWQRVQTSVELEWVRLAVLCRESLAPVGAYRSPTGIFEAVPPALVADGRAYAPDPTLHSGWMVLSEEARAYLDDVARRAQHTPPPARASSSQRAAVYAVAAFALMSLLGAAGALAASLAG